MGNADALSRLPLSHRATSLPGSASSELFNYGRGDCYVNRTGCMKNYDRYGWPNHINEPNIKPYASRKNKLTVEENCVMCVYRYLRNSVTSATRGSSWGSSDENAGETLCGMDYKIEDMMKRCAACQLCTHNTTKRVRVSWPETSRVVERVHVDFMKKEGKRLLILVDAYSKLVEVCAMQSTMAEKAHENL
ncbi:hypothetical protein PR048_024312 [Dryococelus australis]|uniref:Uncharacterized protein n=1 Tax=Dryococelus australis TaxID=614101 RepID=A0ABQ9GNA7_9NEOP|nr:hypothetical protein PR048_024312 [Dryococelus australis]